MKEGWISFLSLIQLIKIYFPYKENPLLTSFNKPDYDKLESLQENNSTKKMKIKKEGSLGFCCNTYLTDHWTITFNSYSQRKGQKIVIQNNNALKYRKEGWENVRE